MIMLTIYPSTYVLVYLHMSITHYVLLSTKHVQSSLILHSLFRLAGSTLPMQVTHSIVVALLFIY